MLGVKARLPGLGALIASAALAALPVTAGAQAPPAPTLPSSGQTLSRTPPVTLPRPTPSRARRRTQPPSRAPGLRTLPRTGLDLRWLVAAGAALLLAGIGLRWRTGDVRSP